RAHRPSVARTRPRPTLLQEPRDAQAARRARPGGAVRRALKSAVDPGGRVSAGSATALAGPETTPKRLGPGSQFHRRCYSRFQSHVSGGLCADTRALVLSTRMLVNVRCSSSTHSHVAALLGTGPMARLLAPR